MLRVIGCQWCHPAGACLHPPLRVVLWPTPLSAGLRIAARILPDRTPPQPTDMVRHSIHRSTEMRTATIDHRPCCADRLAAAWLTAFDRRSRSARGVAASDSDAAQRGDGHTHHRKGNEGGNVREQQRQRARLRRRTRSGPVPRASSADVPSLSVRPSVFVMCCSYGMMAVTFSFPVWLPAYWEHRRRVIEAKYEPLRGKIN